MLICVEAGQWQGGLAPRAGSMNPDQCWRKPLCRLSSEVPQWESRQLSTEQNFLNLSQKSKPKNALFGSCKINLSTLKITRTKPKDESDSEWVSKTCVSTSGEDCHSQILRTLATQENLLRCSVKGHTPRGENGEDLIFVVSKLHPASNRSSVYYRKMSININCLSDEFSRS